VVDGKVDTSNTPPKVLVDTIRTDIKAAATGPEQNPAKAAAKPGSDNSSKPEAPQEAAKSAANSDVLPANKLPARATAVQAAESPNLYPAAARSGNSGTGGLGESSPPPPDNFPKGWEVEWQPNFDNAATAGQAETLPDASGTSGTDPKPSAGTEEPRDPPVQSSEALRIAEAPVEIKPTVVVTMEAPLPPSLPSLYVPLAEEEKHRDQPPKQITVMLRSTGDKEHDRRRIKTIYGTLISFHGRDRFSFHIFEDGRGILMDFPGETTRVCPEMLARLLKLTGEENWRVEEITFH
jgi:hypothetical protein